MIGTSPWVPVIATIFAWWFSTGAILYLVRLPRKAHMPILLFALIIVGLSVWGLESASQNVSPAGTFCGFLCTLVIWGWHEASFLMGKITGPRPKPCPEGATGWPRFGYATGTLIYHEIALFVTLLALMALTWGSPNMIGVHTFGLLFALRLSAKFNIFLGVPNLSHEFFPAHLAHLKSYLPRRNMTALMPISLAFFTVVALWIWQKTGAADPMTGELTGLVILLTLTGLGLLEHVFMITPLPDASLWRWAMPVPSGVEPDKVLPLAPPQKSKNA